MIILFLTYFLITSGACLILSFFCRNLGRKRSGKIVSNRTCFSSHGNRTCHYVCRGTGIRKSWYDGFLTHVLFRFSPFSLGLFTCFLIMIFSYFTFFFSIFFFKEIAAKLSYPKRSFPPFLFFYLLFLVNYRTLFSLLKK